MPGNVEKVGVTCPKCNTYNYVLWFPWKFISGGSEKKEKVHGNCSKCNYKFTPEDLE